MAYTLIRGKFQIHYPDQPLNGPQPDGDTLRFEPDQPVLLDSLIRRGSGPRFNSRGLVSIRLEAVDALETHYAGDHQPLDLGNAARDALLSAVGYTSVTFNANGLTVDHAEPLTPRGYLLARTLDRYGRVVAFVFPGEPSESDGAQVCLRPPRLLASANAKLLDTGLVYPAFYDTLPGELREALAEVGADARSAQRGIWPHAQGTPSTPAVIRNADDVQSVVIFPKLFRRLSDYFGAQATGLAGFLDWLREVPGERDDSLVLPPMDFANLHDIVMVEGNNLWLTRNPETFVIIDTPETWRSGLQQSGCVEEPPGEVQPGDIRIVAALPNPVGQDRDYETVTLLNTLADPVDLAGYRLQDASGGAGMSLHGVIGSGNALRISLGANLMLGNQGDTVRLLSPTDMIVDEVSYSRQQAASGRSVVFGRD